MKQLILVLFVLTSQNVYSQSNIKRKPLTIDGSEFESIETSNEKAEREKYIVDSIAKSTYELSPHEIEAPEVLEADFFDIEPIEWKILYDSENTNLEQSKEEIWQKADTKISHINRTSEDYIEMAKSCSYTKEGNYLAVYFYNKALLKNNNCSECYLERGKRIENEDYHSALADYKTALKINPKCYNCYEAIGNIYCFVEKNQNYTLARKNYYKALNGLRCNKNDFEEQRTLINEIGMTYFLELEKNPIAHKKYNTIKISLWDSLIKINPLKDYFLERASLKESEFVKDYNGAISDYYHVYNNSNRNNYHIMWSIANCYFELFNYFESLKCFNMAIEIIEKKETNSFTIETLAKLYAGKGECKMNLKDYRGSIEDNQIAISYNLKNSDKNIWHLLQLYTEIGKARILLNDYKNAIIVLNEAIKYEVKWEFFINGEFVTYQAYAYYLIGVANYKNYEKNSIYSYKDNACKAWSKAGDLGYKEAYKYINDNCNN